MKPNRWILVVAWMAAAALAAAGSSSAADNPKDQAAAATNKDLTGSQQKLATEFSDLEGVLMRMRDLIRPTDPNRAALIEKALKESGDRRVSADFQEIVDLLRQDQLGNAARKQGKVNEDLEAILQLLLSEDSAKRLKDRQTELRKYLERLNNIIRDQGNVRGRTIGGENPKPLSVEQGGLAQRTGGLSKDINKSQEKDRGAAKDDDENSDGKNSDGKNNDGKTQPGDGKTQSGDGKSSDKSGKESKAGKEGNKSDKNPKSGKNGKTDPKSDKNDKSDGKPGDKDDKSGDKDDKNKSDADDKSQQGNDDKSQQGSDSKSQQGKNQSAQGKQSKGQQSKSQGQQGQQGQDQDQDPDQQQAQNQNNQQQQDQNPVRKRLQAAQEHMEQAEKRLKKAQKDGAADEQEKALDELKTAKAELEDILRQLREEEMKQLLASLIARMQKVLVVQREVYDGTMRLDKVPVAERSHGHEIESGRLSARERSIVHDVEEALRLLHEEGSAVAMPEALQQVHDDMQQIEQRLGQGKTEVLTQAIETDVIKELEEIVDAFKKAKERAENNKKKPPSPPQNGEPQDPPLIEKIAELKMIKALQMRVNRRTERYAKLIEPGREQTNKDDVFEALRRLADQQKRVYQVTRDLDLGKNE